MCDRFKWDPKSAVKKLGADLSVSVSVGPIGVSKQITQTYDPKKDAYRNCECGKHYNYHKK